MIKPIIPYQADGPYGKFLFVPLIWKGEIPLAPDGMRWVKSSVDGDTTIYKAKKINE